MILRWIITLSSQGWVGIEPTRLRQNHCQPSPLTHANKTRGHTWPRFRQDPRGRSCEPQAVARHDINFEELYSTCASPVVPHPSTGHAHGCLASEIGRDPAFPTRFDRTVDSPEVSLLTPSRLIIRRWEGTD